MIGLAAVILVKRYFKTVPFAAEGGYRRERSVSLGPNPHIFVGFPVNHHIGGMIFFRSRICKEGIPVIHDDINGMNLRAVK